MVPDNLRDYYAAGAAAIKNREQVDSPLLIFARGRDCYKSQIPNPKSQGIEEKIKMTENKEKRKYVI